MTVEAGFAHPEFLAEPAWVWENHRSPKFRLIDCVGPSGCGGPLPDRMAIEGDFLPGAVYLPVHPFLKDPESGLVHVIKAADFTETMRALGVSEDTTVVAYDRFNGVWAARLWWVLRYYGHRRVKVLNGGWARWVTENRPTGPGAEVARGNWTAGAPNSRMLCRIDDVRAHQERGGQLVCVLWPQWYTGKANPNGWKRAGHIPGSVNIRLNSSWPSPTTAAG
jgi:thiosulfate/3-mercaptopyruvate sulfurtransferase